MWLFGSSINIYSGFQVHLYVKLVTHHVNQMFAGLSTCDISKYIHASNLYRKKFLPIQLLLSCIYVYIPNKFIFPQGNYWSCSGEGTLQNLSILYDWRTTIGSSTRHYYFRLFESTENLYCPDVWIDEWVSGRVGIKRVIWFHLF